LFATFSHTASDIKSEAVGVSLAVKVNLNHVKHHLNLAICRMPYHLTRNSFIHSGYFYSTSSSPLILRFTPDYSIDTVSELTRQSALSLSFGEQKHI